MFFLKRISRVIVDSCGRASAVMSYNRPYSPAGPTVPSYSGSGLDSYGRQQSLSNPYGVTSPPNSYGGGYEYNQTQQSYGVTGTGIPYSSTSSYGGYSAPSAPSTYPPQDYGPPRPQPSSLFPPNTDQAIVQIFQQADVDRSGTIDANELGRLLSEGRVRFSPRTLRLMLHLFADNPADPSRIGPQGFVNLWRELGIWHEKFMQYDRDRSGTIDVRELQEVLFSFNFAIPPSVLDMLVKKYDHTGYNRSIGYGQFIECGFIVKGLTEKFKDQDRARNGTATFDYTSFMLMVIPFIAA